MSRKTYKVGVKVRTKRGATLYKSEDPPIPDGSIEAGISGKIILGPHMGKSVVKFENGESGWVNNGDLEILD
jgi:hypothetical protein